MDAVKLPLYMYYRVALLCHCCKGCHMEFVKEHSYVLYTHILWMLSLKHKQYATAVLKSKQYILLIIYWVGMYATNQLKNLFNNDKTLSLYL